MQGMEQPNGSEPFVVEQGRPCLMGGRRKSDGKIVFPMPQGTEAALFDPVRLQTEGRLWSYTVQRFKPKSPPYAGAEDEKSFKPFALGYVELPGEVIVEARIEVPDFAQLKIGMPLRLGLAPFARTDGKPAQLYVFRPAA